MHPNTPITVVEGPLAPTQLLETPLLNQLNFSTLIATKAARMVEAAQGRPVLEFGMRRAAAEGADAASRASIVGGAVSTSNAAVGLCPRHHAGRNARPLDGPACSSPSAKESAPPSRRTPTYTPTTPSCSSTRSTHSGSGVPNAIAVFERLRREGHRPVGIRLDSGDLAYLAVHAARELDGAGFPDVSIVLSSQLDELTIWQIMSQITTEARRLGSDPDAVIGRLVLGVGSRLATSDGDPSLDGVFKLVAVVGDDATWQPAIKRSDSPVKVLNPGRKRLWRVYDERGRATADVLSTDTEVITAGEQLHLHHHSRPDLARTVMVGRVDQLLVPVVERGTIVADDLQDLAAAGDRRVADIEALDPGVRRLVNPHRITCRSPTSCSTCDCASSPHSSIEVVEQLGCATYPAGTQSKRSSPAAMRMPPRT